MQVSDPRAASDTGCTLWDLVVAAGSDFLRSKRVSEAMSELCVPRAPTTSGSV